MKNTSNKTVFLTLFACMIISCNYSDWGSSKNKSPELTHEQESALDAFTKLQVSSDKNNRIYSTFPGITHPCFPADTSIVLTQSDLLLAMTQFGKENYTKLGNEECTRLIELAVLAQKEYKVLHCADHTSKTSYENGLPMTGSWVMPHVLDRVDVTLVW